MGITDEVKRQNEVIAAAQRRETSHGVGEVFFAGDYKINKRWVLVRSGDGWELNGLKSWFLGYDFQERIREPGVGSTIIQPINFRRI